MRSRTTRQFREAFAALPDDIKQRAREAYRRFLDDPGHPGLSFKPVRGVPGVWSARVGLGHRALAVREGDDVVWFWIGTHADYDKILK